VETAATTWRPANRSGHRGARTRGQQGRGNEPEEEGGEAWACAEAGGGVRGAASAASGSGRSRAEGKRWCQRKTKQGGVKGTYCNSQKVQGPLCKLKFLTATKGQMRKCST
jgi:hypothetical protein